jgi:lysophospholipase L1-like esterase
MFNPDFWTVELRHRKPNLLIINYGTNEASSASFVDGPYERELREAVRRARAAVPEASLLLMSPMDRGERTGLDEIQTMTTIPKIVNIEERVAADMGVAFFNTFDAMGGAGTMARWYQGKQRLVAADLIHPGPAGAQLVAKVFVKELMLGYNLFKLRHLREGGAGAGVAPTRRVMKPGEGNLNK